MTRELHGRVAVITGSANGVGRAAVMRFLEAGATVVGVDVDEANNAGLASECHAVGDFRAFTADLAHRDQIADVCRKILSDHEHVAILFNNAGAPHFAGWEETDDALWDRMIAINLTAPFLFTRNLLPGLKKAREAAVVHHSSVDGLRGNPSLAAYSVAKGGLTPMTHLMAYEFAPYDIRVNSIISGGIATTMVPADRAGGVIGASALKRLGTPEEVAEVALFLASPRASFMTGSEVHVEGGRIGLTNGTY